MSSVTVKGLVKRHGEVVAVDGVDLDIADGELVVLLGPSGCGKTTTLRCIAGLEDVSEGEIAIGGKVVSSTRGQVPPEKRSVGMVFQSYALWPHMTVAENLGFGLRLRGLDEATIRSRVDTTLAMVGLDSVGSRNAGELSGGQQQRVALARAVVLEPEILLFDEPLSNLDAKMRERMRVEIRKLQKRLGITAIYVTHDQQEAMVIADRIVLMRAGRIEQIGRPREVYDRPRTRFAAGFVGMTNMLPGKVMSADDTHVQVEAGGLQWRSARNGNWRNGDVVDVLIRPEHIEVHHGPIQGTNAFEGKVAEALFLGNTGELTVEAGGNTLRVQLSPAGDIQEQQRVWLKVEPTAVALLDPADSGLGKDSTRSAQQCQ